MPTEFDPNRLAVPLSDEEIDELESFLLSDTVSDETMTLDMLDGYFTAIVVGPAAIVPSKWLPGVWGDSEDDAPEYESMEQAQRILELMLRHMNGVVWSMEDDPDQFEPMMATRPFGEDAREYLDGEMWAYGFVAGIELNRPEWQALFDDPAGAAALRPLLLLGAEDITEEDETLVRTPAQREELSKQIAASVATIYRFWLPYRAQRHDALVETVKRQSPKVGRNDPCPCGSGKKYKKCCGGDTTLH